jgi:hypothetical protein
VLSVEWFEAESSFEPLSLCPACGVAWIKKVVRHLLANTFACSELRKRFHGFSNPDAIELSYSARQGNGANGGGALAE